MAISVNFWTYSKKTNSTAIPASGSASVTFQMELKEPCSAIHPTLVIAASDFISSSVAPTIYNYCQIPSFQRYYHVIDWVYNAGVWEVSLIVDPLGSWKSAIGTIECLIERSSYTFDGSIMDTIYPAKTNFDIQHIGVSGGWYNIAPSGGSYILGCISYQNYNNIGAIAYYACSQTDLGNLMDFLFGNSIYTSSNIIEMGQGLYQSFFNPFQYVVSCLWLPFAADTFGDARQSIKVGYWETGIQAYRVTTGGRRIFVNATIPNHPQAATRGAYLNQSPYTRLTLYLPPFGNIAVDTRGLVKGNYLYCPVNIDHITGEATIRINITSSSSISEYNYLTERTAQIGVPIQLAQVWNEYNTNPTGLVQDILAEGILSLIGSTVGSSINCGTPRVTTAGANGSFINYMLMPELIAEYARISDDRNSDLGKPLMQVKTINTIPGYIKAIAPPIALPITDQETKMIKDAMENGFYYE